MRPGRSWSCSSSARRLACPGQSCPRCSTTWRCVSSEADYFRFAARYGISTIVYSVLAGGVLTGQHRAPAPGPGGSRFDGNTMYQRRFWTERLFRFVASCAEVARAEGISAAELAYAWVASRPGVDAMLLGPATVEHLDVALSGCARKLSSAAESALNEVGAAFAGNDATYAR